MVKANGMVSAIGLLVALFLLAAPLACASTHVEYQIVLRENGDALVIVALNGSGLVNIPLPLDAKPAVKGAVYLPSENGIDVQLGEIPAAVAYKTNLYTAKTQDWLFEAELSNRTTASLVILPKTAGVLNTDPKGTILSGDTLEVRFASAAKIGVTYSFTEGPAQDTGSSTGWIAYAAIGVLLIVFLYWGLSRRSKTGAREAGPTSTKTPSEQAPTVNTTVEPPSKKEHIIKTLTRNEAIITRQIQEEGGEMKRNDLERKSKLSKSSLAAALNSLERKNILTIDKAQTVHFIQFTDWFKTL